ncbi:hypothetical protein ACOMHN_016454 [Nucella lapillus]
MRCAECSTDHHLLRSKVNLQVRRKRRPQGKKPPQKMDVRKVNNPDVTAALQNELSKRLEQVDFTKGQTEENWAKLRNEVNTAAKETIDTLKRHHQDLFDDNDSIIRSLLAEKPDGIPPEVFKAGSQLLIQKFTEFLCMCWEDGCLPQDLKDARIVHLYKGKEVAGDGSSSTGMIAGAAVGAVVFIVAIIIVLIFFRRYRRKKKAPLASSDNLTTFSSVGFTSHNEESALSFEPVGSKDRDKPRPGVRDKERQGVHGPGCAGGRRFIGRGRSRVPDVRAEEVYASFQASQPQMDSVQTHLVQRLASGELALEFNLLAFPCGLSLDPAELFLLTGEGVKGRSAPLYG